MSYYTYSPLSSYAPSRSKSPLPHLNEKSDKLGVRYTTLACVFLLLALLFTWCHYMESKKSDAELVDRYGDGNVKKFVSWCGSDNAKYLTWFLWVLFAIVVIPQAKDVRKTVF